MPKHIHHVTLWLLHPNKCSPACHIEKHDFQSCIAFFSRQMCLHWHVKILCAIMFLCKVNMTKLLKYSTMFNNSVPKNELILLGWKHVPPLFIILSWFNTFYSSTFPNLNCHMDITIYFLLLWFLKRRVSLELIQPGWSWAPYISGSTMQMLSNTCAPQHV